jgi:tRNA-dihydrouridine synthase C
MADLNLPIHASTAFERAAPDKPETTPQLLLAPMEGLLDFVLRDILTRTGGASLHGGIDRCVSEFIRVTNTLLPARAFYRVMPELLNNGKTLSGVPVRGQLLGSDPSCLADNAARLATLGPEGVDLNFGCPAKVVNRHGGGAALLEDPELLFKILQAVRRAVPTNKHVSAKMRLGFNDASRAVECAIALAEGGASELVVHARTKLDGYRPPAFWERIPAIRQAVSIRVIANGEIWTVEDAQRCREVSGCEHLMIGRGMVTSPGLALAIKASSGPYSSLQTHCQPTELATWQSLQPQVEAFWLLVQAKLERKHQAGRLKQWLNFLRRTYPEGETLYQLIRTTNDPQRISALLTTPSPAAQHPI